MTLPMHSISPCKSLSLGERWHAKRDGEGRILAYKTLSPATAGALPKGEPYIRAHMYAEN